VRIISGEFGGRRLKSPKGEATRPMLDRVREAMFSSLGALVDGAHVLDLFAGTGSLGLEALSRGAASVRFVESDKRARRVLLANVAMLEVEDRAEVTAGDALSASLWAGPDGASEWARIIFADPPYPLVHEREGRRKMFAAVAELAADVLAPGGALILHTHPRDAEAKDFPEGFELERREYGRTALWYLLKPLSEVDAPPVGEAGTA